MASRFYDRITNIASRRVPFIMQHVNMFYAVFFFFWRALFTFVVPIVVIVNYFYWNEDTDILSNSNQIDIPVLSQAMSKADNFTLICENINVDGGTLLIL